MTTLLERADTEYRRIKERRQHLREEEARLRKELPKALAQGRDQDQGHDIGNRLRAIAEELQLTQGEFALAERRARQEAAKRIMEAAEYKKAVMDAAVAWAAAIDLCQPLVRLTQRAGCEGVGLPALPSTIGAQVAAKAWVNTMIAAGVLSAEALPPALGELVAGD